jgi:hypothetical protein
LAVAGGAIDATGATIIRALPARTRLSGKIGTGPRHNPQRRHKKHGQGNLQTAVRRSTRMPSAAKPPRAVHSPPRHGIFLDEHGETNQ